MTPEPLTPNRIYYVNESRSNFPIGYYYLKSSYYYNSSDEDIMIEGTSSISPVSFLDSDDDGIIDSCDDCPNEAGPSSNNGCEITAPTLQKTTIRVINNTTNEVIYDNGDGLDDNNSLPVWINRKGDYTITFRYRNVGSARFNGGGTMTMHLSSDSSYKDDDFDCPLGFRGMGDLGIGLEGSQAFDLKVNTFNQVEACNNRYLSNGYTYYLLFRVTNSDEMGDTIMGNLLIKYSTAEVLSRNQTIPSQLEAYDFSGSQVLSKEVRSIEDKEQVIQSLPKGNYIIKANDETYKIKKD